MTVRIIKDELPDKNESTSSSEHEYVKANWDKPDRDIADELGISIWAVQRRRKHIRNQGLEQGNGRRKFLEELKDLLVTWDSNKQALDEVESNIFKLLEKIHHDKT